MFNQRSVPDQDTRGIRSYELGIIGLFPVPYVLSVRFWCSNVYAGEKLVLGVNRGLYSTLLNSRILIQGVHCAAQDAETDVWKG